MALFKYPFKIAGCTKDKYWRFKGDDSREYCDTNGAYRGAILRIGHDYPQLKSLQLLNSRTGQIASKRLIDIDEQFKLVNVERPKPAE